jgi:hypothetical protein
LLLHVFVVVVVGFISKFLMVFARLLALEMSSLKDLLDWVILTMQRSAERLTLLEK